MATTKVAVKKVVAKKAAVKKPAVKKAAVKTIVAKKAAPRKPPAASPAPAAKDTEHLDPAAQLDKLDADAPPPRARASARSAPQARSGPGFPVVAGLPVDFFAGYTGETLSEAALAAAAASLGCEVAAVKAVAEVESRGSGFDAQRRPTVLYERQVFSRNCKPKGKFDTMPDISAPTGYGPGNYGNTESQWQKIAKAYALDPVAALKAPSWGIFQILGENHRACGFADVADFVRLMVSSQVGHLQVFVAFIRANPRLLQAIRARDWTSFARGYNGPTFARFQYDTKIAAAYARHAGGRR